MAGRVPTPSVPARPRRRDPEGHRTEILAAAREAFATRGYDRATVRDIAERAGVTHGSVLRHFGSKERLFVAAVPGARDVDNVAPGPRETLPDRIATAFVERMESVDDGAVQITALILSATDRDTAVRLHAAIVERSAGYRVALGAADPDTDIRLQLQASLLIGVTFNRYILKVGPLAQLSPDEMTGWLAKALRGIHGD